MDSNRRIPINVSNSPSDYSGRSYRLGGQTDIREKMNQRMREFEDESRKWREQFMGSATPLDRPRMFFNFPEFPELSPSFSSPLSSRLTGPTSFFPSSSSTLQPLAPSSHKSFMEEDDHGQKKFKITFDIGDFKPSEIQVKTDGRQLIVKGDREIQAGSAVESKQFNREITLPDFVEPTSVQSFLADGVLTVEAPVQLDRLSYSSGNNQALRHSPLRDNQSPARSATTSTSTANYSRNPPAPLQTNSGNYGFDGGLQQQQQQQQQQPVVYKFNMGEFKPEDIAITVTDTTLKVHAVREENDHSSGNTYREFKREIGLPYGADVKRLSNKLQSDGLLVIEIPVVDNAGLRPPLSPTNVAKQFNNFSLEDNSNQQRTTSTSVQAAPTTALTNTGGLINSVNDGKELRLTFDLTGYKPEDLSIKVIDNNTLKINAVHIDNTRGNQIHREYTRQYQLPEWVQPEHLRARMSDNGTLTVEVPVPQIQPSKYERLINIQNH